MKILEIKPELHSASFMFTRILPWSEMDSVWAISSLEMSSDSEIISSLFFQQYYFHLAYLPMHLGNPLTIIWCHVLSLFVV